ncbi:rhodanese-like domain-containing protein [Lysobacter terrae]
MQHFRHHIPLRPLGALVLAGLLSASGGVAGSTCPLAAAARPSATATAPQINEDRTCLVDARSVGDSQDVFDLRSRGEYLDYHLPQAKHASVSALSALRRGNDAAFVAYDNGKSRSATFLLCEQLRRAGLNQVKLIDGGIASWTQAHDRPERLATSRLADNEVMAALADRHTAIVALTAPLKAALTEHRLGAGSGTRLTVLADPSTPMTDIEAQLKGKGIAFYWVGTAPQLRDLIHAHLLQDRKRLAGPAQSATCSAL